MRIAFIAPIALFAVLAVAFFVGLGRGNNQELPSVFIDKPSPALPDGTLDGYLPAAQGMLNEPGLKLVNFWASWCPPCRAEHPNLLKLQDEGWTIIGVNKSDEPANAKAFLGELGNPYTAISADQSGRQSIEWGVYGLPETFLIDANGRIRLRHPGPVTARVWESRFVPIIEALKTGS